MDQQLEQREARRETRNGLGRFVMGLGVSLIGVGLLVRFDGPASHPDAAMWLMTAGAPLALAGAIWAWANRPGEDAKRLGASVAVVERAHRNRSIMLVLSPLFMLFFAGASLVATQDLLAGQGDNIDRLMIGAVIAYAWLGPLIVMGRGGLTARQRRVLEDELTRHHRAMAVGLGLVTLLAGVSGALVVGLWRLEWGVQALPLVLCLAGAATTLRFGWLDRKAAQDG